MILAIDYHFYPLNFSVPSMLKVKARDENPKGSSILALMFYYDPSRLLFPPIPN